MHCVHLNVHLIYDNIVFNEGIANIFKRHYCVKCFDFFFISGFWIIILFAKLRQFVLVILSLLGTKDTIYPLNNARIKTNITQEI